MSDRAVADALRHSTFPGSLRRHQKLALDAAVQAPWADTWRGHFDSTVDCGTNRSLAEPLTVLTYQSLAVLERDDDSPGQRRAAIHGTDRAALLGVVAPQRSRPHRPGHRAGAVDPRTRRVPPPAADLGRPGPRPRQRTRRQHHRPRSHRHPAAPTHRVAT